MAYKKIVITTEDASGLRSPVCRKFGKSPAYVIATVDSGRILKVVSDVNRRFNGHQLGLLQTASRSGATVLLAGAMEPRVQAMFNDSGVEVVCDLHGPAEEVLERYLSPTNFPVNGRISP